MAETHNRQLWTNSDEFTVLFPTWDIFAFAFICVCLTARAYHNLIIIYKYVTNKTQYSQSSHMFTIVGCSHSVHFIKASSNQLCFAVQVQTCSQRSNKFSDLLSHNHVCHHTSGYHA
jgi:hypothetical protein